MTLGLKLVRFIVILLPASLNNLSLATEVAGIAKKFPTNELIYVIQYNLLFIYRPISS